MEIQAPDSALAALASETEQLVYRAPADLIDSPFQPRQEYADLPALQATILACGRILQPLVARLRPVDGSADVHELELVFGHRRKRAAQALGMAAVPVLIVAMTDAEVRAAQMAENVSRDNMRALEEARGYRAQIDQDGLTREQVANDIGKSVSHVTARLRLLTLCPEVMKALQAGEVQAEVALLVARTGDERMQRKALGYIKGKALDLTDGGQMSYRRVKDLLNERFTLQLSEAIFDPEDETLLPDAGHCLRCPKLSANAPEFDDVLEGTKAHHYSSQNYGPRVCTDPDCFDEKKKAHLRREASKLQAAGKTVVEGARARQAIGADGKVKGAYISAAEVKAELKATAEKTNVKPVTIQDPRGGKTVQAYRVEDLKAAGVKVSAATGNAAQRAEAERQKREADHAKEEARRDEEAARRLRLLLAVRATAATRELGQFEARMTAAALLSGVSYWDQHVLEKLHDVKSIGQLRGRIDTMNPEDLRALIVDCLIVDNCSRNELHTKPGPLLALAQQYGMDAKAVMSQTPATSPAAAASAPAPAAGAPTPRKAAQAKGKAGAVKYRNPITGDTWSGRGLKPKWLAAALASGHKLADFDVKDDAGAAGEPAAAPADGTDTPPTAAQAKNKAAKAKAPKTAPAKAGAKVKDGAGVAGEADAKTADLFEATGAPA